jgi:TadE-like protein
VRIGAQVRHLSRRDALAMGMIRKAKRNNSSRMRRQAGATLVEWAFVFIMLLLVFFGISGFGHMLYVYHFVDHAAKEGARYASVRGATCGTLTNSSGQTVGDSSCIAANSASGTAGPADTTDISQFVMNITPPGIDTSSGGCGGAACLQTLATWPVQSAASANPSPKVCSAPDAGKGSGTAAYPNWPGCTVQVNVSYKFSFIFPLLPWCTSTTPCNLSSTSQMVIEH